MFYGTKIKNIYVGSVLIPLIATLGYLVKGYTLWTLSFLFVIWLLLLGQKYICYVLVTKDHFIVRYRIWIFLEKTDVLPIRDVTIRKEPKIYFRTGKTEVFNIFYNNRLLYTISKKFLKEPEAFEACVVQAGLYIP